mgnify:CR=1 FL=1|jgi:hypothetical protein|nr:MAG TPA: hypothetical protein [Caudoviricetes sp.]
MTKIPAETKTEILSFGDAFKFSNREEHLREINHGVIGLAKKAIAGNIADDQPYTFRINFQNGRIVGESFDPRFSIEKLDGRSETTEFSLGKDQNTKYLEYKSLDVDYKPSITNGDSWVARVKIVDGAVVEAFVNPDFDDPEERKLIKDALMRGFKHPEIM